MTELATSTRYERVRQILDDAAGESMADYGGTGRFWHLPIGELLRVEIGGVRMIAAPDDKAEACPCCEHESRSARSGLIRGLRGEAPFDGARYPRLPWGGSKVSADDIAFISEWIDDGCSADDRELSLKVTGKLTEPKLETVTQPFEVFDGSPNEYKYAYGEVKQRMNLDCMSEAQLDLFRSAFREMYRLNKWTQDIRNYNSMALIHQNHCQHGWERFLPWHRIYLYEFEQAMQDAVPGVTMPYWDWTMPQYMPEHPEKGWIIPESYKAFLTKKTVEWLETADPPLPKKAGHQLMTKMVDKGLRYTSPTTFFAAIKSMIGEKYTAGDHRDRFIDALLAANALWYPLRYPAEYQVNGKSEPINVAIQYHYPTANDIAQILSVRTFRDFGGGSLYDDSFGFLDQNPHNTMHIWTGGENPNAVTQPPDFFKDLGGNRNRATQASGRRPHSRSDLYSQPATGDMFSNLTASYDPIFWPIHSNVDRLWHEWQELHPNSNPADLTSVLTPWSYTIADTLDMARFGYEYVKCSYIVPVGLSTTVGRFVSKPIEIPKPARKAFRQAEVRLHRVPQLPRSCFIRVFLNLPDANASTPIDHTNYAGYLAVFGHGDCIGAPGHCALPPRSKREYDLRPRDHNTPRNHRINVTKAAKRLLDKGATSLQITLVVIGADYREDSELLRLDGVSLDFLD